MRVKGAAIIDLVKIIRAQKHRDWSQHLAPADLDIVNSIVLPTSYYPGDSFWRISWAVTKEVAGGNLEKAFIFGRESAKTYLSVYKRLVVEGDPATTIENFVRVWTNFYDVEGAPYEGMQLEKGPGFVRIVAHDYPDMDIPEARKPYFHGLAGYFQEIAEQTSGRPIRNTVTDHGSSFELTYRWS